MKKLLFSLILLLVPSILWAATITCTETSKYVKDEIYKVTLVCTGDSDTTIALSSTTNSKMLGKLLYEVRAYPTSGGTQPDAGNVTVTIGNITDVLGGQGTGLIPSTATPNRVHPYSSFDEIFSAVPVDGAVSVSISGLITAGADFTLELYSISIK